MKIGKWIFSVVFFAFFALGAALAASPASTVKADWFAFEAMWIAGGSEYQQAVHRLATIYAKKMDKYCRASVMAVNIAPAIKAYGVFVPRGAEHVRDSLVRKQIATMACITVHGERHAATVKLM